MAYDRSGLTHAARKFVAITPSDTVALMPGATGIYVGGTGNVVVVDLDNVTTTFSAVPVGYTLPISPKLIKVASTATLMVAIY